MSQSTILKNALGLPADPGVLGLDHVAPMEKYGKLQKKVSAHDPELQEEQKAFEKDPMGYMDKVRRRYTDHWSIARELAPQLASLLALVMVYRRMVQQGPVAGRLARLAMMLTVLVGFYSGRNWFARPPLVQNAPGAPTFHPIVGHFFTLVKSRKDFHGMLKHFINKTNYGPLELCVPGKNIIILHDARDNEYILRRNFRNYPNNVPSHMLRPGMEQENLDYQGAELAGRGIFMTDGPEWAFHRKRASHMFSANELQHRMQEVFHAHARKFCEALRVIASNHEVVDIQDLIASVVFDTFCEIGFGVDTKQFDEILRTGKKPEFLAAFDLMQYQTAERIGLPGPVWRLMRLFGVGTEGDLQRSAKIVNDYVYPIVRARLANKHQVKHRDLLSLYMDDGDDMDEHTLRDIILNFMIAGRDTTSSTLSSSVTFLSQNPDTENKLREKLNIGRDLSWDDMKQFVYPNAFINEVLRMNPPVPSFFRVAAEDDVLPSGQPVKSGYRVAIPMRQIGHRSDLWRDPESFTPERWIVHGEDVPVKRPDEYVFPVFWGGYRLCLGKDMARAEALTFLKVMLVEYNLKIRLEPNQDLDGIANGPVHFIRNGIRARVIDGQNRI